MTTATPSRTTVTAPHPSSRLPQPLTSPRATTSVRGSRRGRSARRAWNVAATAVIWLTSLFVLALWVAGGGIQDLWGFDAAALNSLGRLTGLVASNLLLYQVILLARIPLFERGFGRDGLTRMHRLVGFWSFALMLAHIALLVLGYAAAADVNIVVQLWEFVWDYPGMLLATAGTILIILVAITSMRRARASVLPAHALFYALVNRSDGVMPRFPAMSSVGMHHLAWVQPPAWVQGGVPAKNVVHVDVGDKERTELALEVNGALIGRTDQSRQDLGSVHGRG